MTTLDWVVLVGAIGLIVAYGAWKTREVKTVDVYLRGGSDLRWWTIGLSIMATQASAITFLSMPGQAYQDGMGFVQFYLGLPIAMVILSAIIVPIYYKLKVYTAYEYLETRFDQKTRQLVALLFLLSRGLGAGISLYAPAIVLSTLLGWPLRLTTLVLGAGVIAYTVSGGTRVVSRTQTWQMVIMLGGMAAAFAFVLHRLPPSVSFDDALGIGGVLGKMKIVDFSPRVDTRYTLWSGLTGGLFVQLAYFGTDQSQVQRYLSGSPLTESRLGLMFNGLVKVPMQFGILMVGVLLVVFYQFHRPPIFFNRVELGRAEQSERGGDLKRLEREWDQAWTGREATLAALLEARHAGDAARVEAAATKLRAEAALTDDLRKRAVEEIGKSRPRAETKDADYIFLGFVLAEFPAGLVGLLIAVILCAAMSATASALNSLGTTSVVDFYKRSWRPDADDAHYLRAARGFTIFWGAVAVVFAASASLFDNLIQAVNILGSIFYGPMLGVFLIGFFTRRIGGTAAFVGTVAAQAAVVAVWLGSSVGFLWYNVVGCGVVVVVSSLLAVLSSGRRSPA
ncbi:MAG: solute/sodium symporter family protein [Myxococcales bacterium]|nr:solute/sodium symporter family protein [Myxococcales bacterium]